jgi:dihydrofolate reductase
MRKLVIYTLMSLDGDVDDPGAYFVGSQPNAAPTFDEAMIENERRIIATQDTVLLGRHMYDQWSGYWPTSNEQPFADFINGVHKVVVTSSPLAKAWNNAAAMSGPIADIVRTLKSRPGQDIGVHGSITLAQSLLAAGLVDELQFVVGPAVGFGGRRLFEKSDSVSHLELLSASSTPSGCLLLGYRVSPIS